MLICIVKRHKIYLNIFVSLEGLKYTNSKQKDRVTESGYGTVDVEVANNPGEPRFEPSLWQSLFDMFSLNAEKSK